MSDDLSANSPDVRAASSAAAGARRAALILFAALFVGALAVRIAHLAVFSGATVFFDPAPWNTPLNPLAPGEYDRWGMQINYGDPWWTDHGPGVYFQSPVYPYFVALVYLLGGGRNVLAVTVVQAVLGALTCALTGLLARRTISPRAGWVAGLLAAVYGPAIFYESFLLKETLATFLVTVATMLAVILCGDRRRAGEADRRWPLVLVTGITWGAAVAAWPLIAPVAGLVFVWCAWRSGSAAPASRARAAVVAGLLLAGTFIAVLPCTVRNVVGEDRFVLISYAGPRNWAVGNSSNSSGTYVEVPGEPVPPADTWFWTLLMKKIGLFFRGDEIPHVTDYDLLRDVSPVLRLPLPGFGVLAPLALVGLPLTLRRRRAMFPVHTLAVVYPLCVALFFVVGRFRLPVVPAFAVLAAATVDVLHGEVLALRNNQARWSAQRAAVGALLAILLVVINLSWPLPRGAYPFHHAVASYYLEMGKISTANGQAQQALAAYAKVMELPAPRHRALALTGRAQVALQLLDRPDEALRDLRRSLEVDPEHDEAVTVRDEIRRLEEAGTR